MICNIYNSSIDFTTKIIYNIKNTKITCISRRTSNTLSTNNFYMINNIKNNKNTSNNVNTNNIFIFCNTSNTNNIKIICNVLAVKMAKIQ